MIHSDPSKLVVRKKVTSVEFGFYTDDDVRARSVVEITSPQTFLGGDSGSAAAGTPLPGGLYDTKLGPFQSQDSMPCPTCAGRFLTCGGHFGHIELCVPLYQPLLMGELLKILASKCFCCHKLRTGKRNLMVAHAKLLLLQHGRLLDYHELDGKLSRAIHAAFVTTDTGEDGPIMSSQNRKSPRAAAAMESILQEVIDELHEKTIDANSQPTMYQRELLRDFTKELIAAWKFEVKCQHCGAQSPKVKQDQYNKIFQKALSAKNKKNNQADDLELVSALETLQLRKKRLMAKKTNSSNSSSAKIDDGYKTDDSEDTEPDRDRNPMVDDEAMEGSGSDDESQSEGGDGDEGLASPVKQTRKSGANHALVSNDTTQASSDQYYMHPGEVRAQCQMTWEHHGPLLSLFLFGSNAAKSPKSEKDSYNVFFVQAIAVPPSRFRPPMTTGGMTVEHGQNQYLAQVLTEHATVRQELFSPQGNERLAHTMWIQLQTSFNCFLDSSKDPSVAAQLGNTPNGIRQLLEKKEGIFRKHMMGKRVDSACRSVISPDPYVGTNEIGIPLAFAQVLTYPTPVTEFNMTELRRLVERGPDNYPGARWVEVRGQRIDLGKMTDSRRRAVGAMLLKESKSGGGGNKPVIVGRQLRHGDTMLVNRQPTLHKPGIMAHQVRVLHNPTQKTIRMHYANCNTYNADFDGDEMNCHFPQSDVARAEAMFIAQTDLQYIVPTDGSPLRGLIQDHVCGGVKLTTRDTFLKRWEYQQLLFATLASLPRLEVLEANQDIQMVPPAILKPEPLWTGKQVITTLLKHLCNSPRGQKRAASHDESNGANMLRQGGLSLERKSKTPGTAFGECHEEHLVIIRDGELLRGILDKAAFGSTDFSMVHGIYEAYGPTKAGLLLNSLGRLFTAYIQFYAGHSCRMEDLILTKEADQNRRDLVQRAYNIGSRACKAWADSDGGKVAIESVAEAEGSDQPLKPVEVATASAKIGQLLGGAQGAENFAALDGYMMSQLNPLASEIVKECLPNGLAVPFPANTFGLMTTTGAKGSIVNQSQVACALGQQALEGRRVPRMNSGKTLPSFAPYDLNPRADGFVMDRFLTGVRPQEYYFHCMAGREGLVDTAVKTSRSGYLQRCLVKHLEELKVCYDYTVRNGENGVVQFLYGEDALDPTKASYLDCTPRSFEFMARNHKSFQLQNTPLPGSSIEIAVADCERRVAIERTDEMELLQKGDFVLARRLRSGSKWTRGALCQGWHEAVIIKRHKREGTFDLEYARDNHRVDDVPKEVDLGRCGGFLTKAVSSVTTLLKPAVADPIMSGPKRINGEVHRLGSSGACVSERVATAAKDAFTDKAMIVAMKASQVSAQDVGELVAAKFGTALCAPGEAVGSIAAQSVGEPSTQMTLNTFHLAGAGANVTLGIPRLREIIMTASKTLKTPTMSIPLQESVSEKEAKKLTLSFKKLTLSEMIAGQNGITVRETIINGASGDWERAYYITLKLHPAERIEAAFGLSLRDIAKSVGVNFIPAVRQLMKKELRRSGEIIDVEGAGATGDIAESGGNDKNADMDVDEPSSPNKKSNTKDDLSDDDNESDDDEGGEEDGVAAMKYSRKEDSNDFYGGADDGADDGDEGVSGLNDFGSPRQTKTQFAPTDDMRVLIDKASNTIALPPLTVDPAARPLLMVGLVEAASEKTTIHSKKGIDEAFVNKEDDGRGRCLQTAGVNFEQFWCLPSTVVDHHRLMSNDIWAIRWAYGVEAARMNIVDQIRSVFGAYGIEVDPRHLSLIADYMTNEGGYKAMNRIGMEQMSSTLLQMSFETTATFLTKAAMTSTKDNLESPSANIVLGRPIRHGTGAFDVMVKASA